MKRIILAISLLFPALNAFAAEPLLSPEDAAFFHDAAKRVVDSARVRPGETSGGMKNTTDTSYVMPDSGHVYPALWIRDSNMCVGADFISNEELLGWIKHISSCVPQAGPDVNVPAYSIPDHMNLNGTVDFFPGLDFNPKGAAVAGEPPLDDAYFFLFDVCDYARLTDSTDFLKQEFATGFGKMKLGELCTKIFDSIAIDKETGLGVVKDPDKGGKDFGFCDTIHKTGKVLFTSLLRYDAAVRLEPLLRKIGDASDADYLRGEATKIKKAIVPTFYHDAALHPGEGWLHSATGLCNQPDVWGSAYAINLDLLDGDQKDKVGKSLVRGYEERKLVLAGCVSEVLQDDPTHPNGWERADVPFPVYQNGGYWGTGSGYYIVALSKVSPATAKAMAHDYVNFLRANQRTDGMSQTWEWFNPNTNTYQHPIYCATVALPYCQMKRAGLLP